MVLLSDNHRSIREISNQYLPNKQSSKRKWVDFPNYLHPKEEISFETNQEIEKETIVEHYLPFSKQEKIIGRNGVVFYKKSLQENDSLLLQFLLF